LPTRRSSDLRNAFIFDELHRLVVLDRVGIVIFGDRRVFLVVQNVRTKTSDSDNHGFFFKQAQITRQLEQLKRVFERHILDKLSRTQTGELRLFPSAVVGVLSYLHVGTELSEFRVYVLACLRIYAELTRTAH